MEGCISIQCSLTQSSPVEVELVDGVEVTGSEADSDDELKGYFRI